MTKPLTAEQIADACANKEGTLNRQAIEDLFEAQMEPQLFQDVLRRADSWPKCRNAPKGVYGLQYAYMIEFLTCDELKKRQMGGVG